MHTQTSVQLHIHIHGYIGYTCTYTMVIYGGVTGDVGVNCH